MKLLSILLVTAFSLTLHAAQLVAFSVVRSGGGSMRIKVTRASQANTLNAVTISCNFKALTPDEQRKTTVVINEDTMPMSRTYHDAEAILDGQAVLAQIVRLNPMPTGTFVSLSVEMPGGVIKEIQNPIVLVDGELSDILTHVEVAARQASAAAGVCK